MAQEMLGQGMITITDITDAPRISCVITPSSVTTQVYTPDGDTYRPSWTSGSPLKLTPIITVNGEAITIASNSKISNLSWKVLTDSASGYVDVNTVSGMTAATSSGGTGICTISKNMTEDASWGFSFTCKYTDVGVSDLTLDIEASITVNKTINGGGVAFADIEAIDGFMIKNSIPESLRLRGALYKGGGIVTDYELGGANINTRMAWFQMDSSASGDPSFGVEAGWKRVTNNIIYWTESSSGIPNGTCQLTVPPTAIPNLAVFLFIVKDDEGNSYRRTITLTDYDDPYNFFIETIGGDKIKNGQGTIQMKVHVYRNGEEVDADGAKFDYKWFKKDAKTNAQVKWVNDTTGAEEGYERLGKLITVTGKNINGKGIFNYQLWSKTVAKAGTMNISSRYGGNSFSMFLEYDEKTL